MPNEFRDDTQDQVSINIDYLTLRKYIGILGIVMPLVLIIGNGFKLEESISHFYYTNMSVFFTGTLIVFGMFLFSYRGYAKEDDEMLSDNIITNMAGILAFIVTFVPTACRECGVGFPNAHIDTVRNSIHLISAGLFITAMGYMSFNQFVKSENTDKLTKNRKLIFRVCGTVIWLMVLFLLLKLIFDLKFSEYDIFWGETVALVFFGFAWLIKGKALEGFGM